MFRRVLERRALIEGDRWIPLVFVGGFLVMLAVNAVMVVLALDTWTGVSVTDAYRKGLAYNETLAEARAQAALGWTVEAAYRPTEGDAAAGVIEVRLETDDGAPLSTAEMQALLRRPDRPDLGHTLTLVWREGGLYDAPVALPLAGLWDLELEVVRGSDRHRSRHRLMVAP